MQAPLKRPDTGSNPAWSTKETPGSEHTKGSIKFRECYLTIDDDTATFAPLTPDPQGPA